MKRQRKLAMLGDDFEVWPEAAPAPADDLKHLSSVAPP